RAIGQDAAAKLQTTDPTSFGDDSQIDPKLRGYVKVAVEMGLVNGVTPTEFKPLSPVTRATAATLFSRAEKHLQVEHQGQISGVLLAILENQLTLLKADGSIQDYPISEDTAFYRFDSEQSSSLAGLRLYGEAILLAGDTGNIEYVEQTSDTAKV